MKTSELEKRFYKTFDIPIDYPLQISNLKYLQLGAVIFNFKNVKEFRQEILKRCIEQKGGIDDVVKQIYRF